jgi:hypothetical protein
MSLILKQEANGSVPTPAAGKGSIFLNVNDQLAVKDSNGVISAFTTISAGSNQIIFANAAGSFLGSANLAFYSTNNALILSGNLTTANANLGNSVTANYFIGNFYGTANSATSATTAGTVTTAAQPNITSLGTLTSLAVTGNVTAGNVYANSGTIGASLLTGTLTTAAQPNITSVGTLTSLDSSGNISAGNILASTGNISGNIFNSLVANGTAPMTVNSQTVVANFNSDLLDGYNTDSSATANTIPVRNADGNLTANFFIGNGSQLTGIITSVSSVINGNSNVNVEANSNITMSVAGNANVLTVTGTGANVTGTLNATGNANVGNLGATGVVATTLSGALTTASQPNITSLGTLSSVTVTGNGSFGNILGPHANGNSNINIPAANGNVNITAAGNANVLVVTGTGVNVAGTMNVTGNLTAGNIITGNGSGGNVSGVNYLTANFIAGTLTTAAQPNITSTGTLTSLAVTGNVTAGNVYANSGTIGASLLTGTLTTAAQPNITSLGTLTSATVTGNVTAGNLYANSGTIGATTGTFSGNISANNLSTTNKVTAGNGLQVTTGAVDILGGNLNVTGNINVTGNLNYSNVTDLVVGDPLIYIGANNTGDTVDLGIVASYNNGTYYHTGVARNAANDYWTFFDGVVAEPTTVIDWANATYPTVKLGNLIATGTANITGNANVGNLGATGVVATTLGGALTTASQPNVTSLGTLTSLGVSGNITAANITANTGVITGNGSGLTAIAGANVTGTVANATYATSAGSATTAGTVTTAAQSNITSVGTLTGLGVNGTITGVNITANTGVFTGNANGLTAIPGGNITGTISSSILGNSSLYVGTTQIALNRGSASQSLTGITSIDGYAATVSTAAQPNITSVGTLTSLGVSGNITAANITANTGIFSGNGAGLTNLAGANVTGTVANATYATSAGSASSATTAGTVTTAAQPNITSVGTLTGLTLSGTLSGAVQIGSGAATHYGTTLTTGANTTAGTVTGNWTLSAGSRFNATYADLAEKYIADADYDSGTVLMFGGEHEVTISNELNTTKVAGVVTTNSAYSMNSGLQAEHIAEIALQGRVPVKVIGPINKGDLLVSATNGHAIVNNNARAGTIIGKSLENFGIGFGVIEVAVGRF